MKLEQTKPYENLLDSITSTIQDGQNKTVKAIRREILNTYWQIGKHIVEFEQSGNAKAEYGKQLIERLSRDLSHQFGKGFGRSNLIYIRLLYLKYPKKENLSHQLSWGHYYELLKIDDETERDFYEKQAAFETWTVRELKRQKNTSLFLRLAASRDKEGILKLAQKGQHIEKPADIIREPYVFEFLNIPEPFHVSEKDIEKSLLDNLQKFLLELGKGFTFVGRQYRIKINNEYYKIDLVFYHRILRCFVLLDLKINEIKHYDIGQMNMYLGYFAGEENIEGDAPPIGIILTREKNELMVEFATYGMSSQLFVSKYQLYLPNEEELRKQLEFAIQPTEN